MKSELITKVVAALALWACVVFCALALISYSPADSPFMTQLAQPEPISNLCGPVGAFIAHHLLMQLGLSVWAVMAMVTLLGWFLVSGRTFDGPWLRLYSGLFLTVSLACLFSLMDNRLGLDPVGMGLPSSFGGIVGQTFSRWLVGLLGMFGGVIVILLVFLASLVVVSNMWVLEKGGSLFSWAVATVKSSSASKPETGGKLAEAPAKVEESLKPQPAPVANGKLGGRLVEPPPDRTAAAPVRKPAAAQAQPDERNLFDIVEDLDATELEEVTEIDTLEPLGTEAKPQPQAKPGLVDKREKREREHKRLATDPDDNYTLPPLSLFDPPTVKKKDFTAALEKQAAAIEQCLHDFDVEAKVVSWEVGPVVTLYELMLPPGVKVQAVSSLQDNLAMNLQAQSLRIIAPIPGKPTVGIETPNPEAEIVRFRDIADHSLFDISKFRLPFFLGKQGAGEPLVADLTKMPHVLIAGATNSGKSVCINAMITTLLTYRRPDEVKLILVDPKMVELSGYQGIPHLMTPVVTDMRTAPGVLDWAVNQMEDRYRLCSKVGVKDIVGYNKLGGEKLNELIPDPDDRADFPDFLPYIVIVVDELADLMMISKKEVEWTITRLAQKARAIGIHLVLATQRPSVNVITGLIKANMPCRISFQLSSRVDSRTIIDSIGAEKLLGRGDMLFMPPTAAKLVRAQGVFVSDEEIKRLLDFIRDQGEPEYDEQLSNAASRSAEAHKGNGLRKPDFEAGGVAAGKRKSYTEPEEPAGDEDFDGEGFDDLFDEAVRVVIEEQRGSVSLLQRRLTVGYGRASRLIDQMEEAGVLGPYRGSKPREILYTLEEWDAKRKGSKGDDLG